MPAPWTIEELVGLTGEPVNSLRKYAAAGPLRRDIDGRFPADTVHQTRLIRYLHDRDITDEQLVSANREYGDLLRLFGPEDADEPVGDLAEGARAAGIDAEVFAQITECVGWDPAEPATQRDLDAVAMLAQALAAGLPVAALLQLLRVFNDVTDRLAEAETRTFHDHVHEQLRAGGLVGAELLSATDAVATPMLEMAEPTLLYFYRRAWQGAAREDLVRHLAEAITPPTTRPGEHADDGGHGRPRGRRRAADLRPTRSRQRRGAPRAHREADR